MKIFFLALWLWSLPSLPPEVFGQTNKSREKSYVPCTQVIYSLHSSLHPARRKGGDLGPTSDFMEENMSSPSPDLSHVHNKFTRGILAIWVEKQFFSVLSSHGRVDNIPDPHILNAVSASQKE